MPLVNFPRQEALRLASVTRLGTNLRLAVALLSLLLSAWSVYRLDIINNDGVLYILAAQRLLAGDWNGAYELYRWLFYPGLIALVSSLSGLDLETSAQVLDALAAALLAATFVTLVQELGGDRKTQLIAGLVILFHPYLNEARPEIVRDHGYWAFYLLSLLFFIRFYRDPRRRHALAWGIAITLATLFRIEGIAFLLLLPTVLWLRRGTPFGQRLKYFLEAHRVTLVLALVLGVWMAVDPEFSRNAGRLHDPFTRLHDFWLALSTGLQEKAQRLREAVLDNHSDHYALPALVAILLIILLDQIVKTLTPLYSVLLFCRPFYSRLQWPQWSEGTLLIFLWAALLNLGIVLVFLIHFSFLSGRYVVPFILLALPAIPFILASVHDHWRLRHTGLAPRRWLLPLILGGLIFTLGDSVLSLGRPSKAYIKEAGLWLREQLPARTRLYANHQRLYYYSGRLTHFWEQVGQMQASKWPLGEQWLLNQTWKHYDYLALWTDHRAEFDRQLARIPDLELIKTFANRNHDAVLIYRVRTGAGGPGG